MTTQLPTRTPTNSLFDITLDFDSTVPVSDRADFDTAALRWEQVIRGDLEDVPTSTLGGVLPAAGCVYPASGVIDDLFLCIYYQPISGDVVGLGGYTFVRNSDGLPAVGFAQIDPDAISAAREFGYFQDIILHEFGHAIGIGTVQYCPSDSINSRANKEYQSISQCSTNIPMQQPGCGHYTEECLRDELMTPVAALGGGPLSRITVGWVEDLGYVVDYGAADPFDNTQLGTVAGCNCNRRLENLEYHPVVESNTPNVQYLGRIENSENRKMQQDPPKLSVAGYGTALVSGMEYLNEQAMNSIGRDFDTTTLRFVGDQFVWVYIREGDHVHSVLVRQ
jgi:Leishmanolysin